MIEISKEELTDKMFFIREENSNQPIAVVKVSDLMKCERPQGEQIAWEQGYEFGKNEKRPQGEWHGSTKSTSYLVCNLCGMSVNYMQVEENYMLNFCPNCGADMRGKEK